MMVHCTVVQPFIVIMGIIELQPSERVEPQEGRSWVELWAAGRGGCCCCLRDLAELPGAAGPWMPEPRCSRSVRAMDRADPCSLVSRSRLDSPHLRVWSVSRGPWRDDLSSPRALPRRLCARSWSCGEGSEVGVVCTFGAKPFYEMARPWARPVPQRRVGASVEVARFLAAVTVRRCENVTHNASS